MNKIKELDINDNMLSEFAAAELDKNGVVIETSLCCLEYNSHSSPSATFVCYSFQVGGIGRTPITIEFAFQSSC